MNVKNSPSRGDPIKQHIVFGEMLRQTLAMLGDKLFREKRVADFHRCILDVDFRNTLMDEVK